MGTDWPVEEVAGGGDVCGEGPTWDAAGERLLWVDNERAVIPIDGGFTAFKAAAQPFDHDRPAEPSPG